METNYKGGCNQLKELTGEQCKLRRQAAFRGNTTENVPLGR